LPFSFSFFFFFYFQFSTSLSFSSSRLLVVPVPVAAALVGRLGNGVEAGGGRGLHAGLGQECLYGAPLGMKPLYRAESGKERRGGGWRGRVRVSASRVCKARACEEEEEEDEEEEGGSTNQERRPLPG
jgi:hypothetical protein